MHHHQPKIELHHGRVWECDCGVELYARLIDGHAPRVQCVRCGRIHSPEEVTAGDLITWYDCDRCGEEQWIDQPDVHGSVECGECHTVYHQDQIIAEAI